METIELKYKLSKKEYLISNLTGTIQQVFTKVILTIGILLNLLWIFQLSTSFFGEEFPFALIALFGLICFPGILILITLLASVAYNSSPRLNEELKVNINPQEITVAGIKVDVVKKIDDITYFRKNGSNYAIGFNDKSGLMIPLKELNNREEDFKSIIGKYR